MFLIKYTDYRKICSHNSPMLEGGGGAVTHKIASGFQVQNIYFIFFSFVTTASSLNVLKIDTHLLIELFICLVDGCSAKKFT